MLQVEVSGETNADGSQVISFEPADSPPPEHHVVTMSDDMNVTAETFDETTS